MKKVLVSTILGLVTATSVLAQGSILLDNYNTSGPIISYGPANANGSSGGTVGAGVTGYNVSLYYFVGSIASTINAGFDGSGYDTPAGMILANPSDAGATSAIDGSYGPGLFANVASYLVPGNQTLDYTVTVVVLAYNGSSYANSTVRGHSAAFTTTAAIAAAPGPIGSVMPAFSVVNANVGVVPEPSTFALAGLGLASLLIFRRRK